MFSSLSNFQVSSFDQPSFFTNPSVELFPSDSDAGTFDEIYNASPHALIGSIEDDLPIGNALDNFEPSSTSSSISLVDVASDIVESLNELVVPSSSHPTQYGIDYEKSFAPVARLTSVRSSLAIVAIWRWKLFQMDVKNDFLNGGLEEEVYMKPPPMLNHPPNKFSAIVIEFGFTSSPHDTTPFIRVKKLKQSLSQKFEMKDIGASSYFLGLEVTSSDDGYLLSQVKYASDIVSKAELNDRKSVSTPLEPNVKLTSMDGFPLFDLAHY
ncbi:hypothetical protein SLEP1_g53680 [Rubroshorea leprosula]|uniref:Reverse transcriptase Ty1/copia-type domain-containing protein n=1 Tax=Rubroshorea leprosula TaxID=152421 RepID=A0AAV5MA17_9ROSI|nr:hypothetical protein SLEP1_g53680 [Rubroshorea leprosula]